MMSKIQWHNSFSTGIPKIDEQHKKLVAMINQLDGSLAASKEFVNRDIGIVLGRLVDYTTVHFGDEEQIQEEIKFSEREEHKQQHLELVEQVKTILINLRRGKSINAVEMLDFLKDWLVNHIVKEDTKIASEYKTYYATHQNTSIKYKVNS